MGNERSAHHVRSHRCCRSAFRAKYRACSSRRPVTHTPKDATESGSDDRGRPGDGATTDALLSNGRYSVALRANGRRLEPVRRCRLSRWRDNALRDAYGTFFYLRRDERSAPCFDHRTSRAGRRTLRIPARRFTSTGCISTRNGPICAPAARYGSARRTDVELRRIELWSQSSKPIRIELMSMFEVSLTDARADEMHPAFANLFVTADWDAKGRALFFARNPRVEAEEEASTPCISSRQSDDMISVRAQTDRAAWSGRNREPSQPLAHIRWARNRGRPLHRTGSDCIAVDADARAGVRFRIRHHRHGRGDVARLRGSRWSIVISNRWSSTGPR